MRPSPWGFPWSWGFPWDWGFPWGWGLPWGWGFHKGCPYNRLSCYNPAMIHPRPYTRMAILLLVLALAACLPAAQELASAPISTASPSPGSPATPSATPSAKMVSATPSRTASPNSVWGSYGGPVIEPVTPIPTPLDPYPIPPEVRVGILLGTDRDAPFIGRTDAMMLMFYNEKLGRASLLALPADLYVYLPGYTMQRLQIAYATGGPEGVQAAVEYNFGVRPLRYALVHPSELTGFVKRLDTLTIDVPGDYSDGCKGILGGRMRMTAAEVLCYVTYRDDMDEVDRNQRQLDVAANIFHRMTQSGKLALLPDLYATTVPNVESNYTLTDLMGYIPLALRMGDPQQLGLFRFERSDLIVWDIPGQEQLGTQGFVPRPGAIPALVQRAVDFVLTPQKPIPYVTRLAYELTASPSATITPSPTRTATRYPTFTRTPRDTYTPRPTYTKVKSRTPTAGTETETETPIPPTETETPIPPTETETPVP